MSKQPMLSITFMTPGKKKTLEMCLESIKWMQQDFPCELVIVDTGCDAEHRALIEGYADKIVDFTWINDFAAARNAGIAACSGEWFMIMDDDEVIKDYKPLKEFFESGDYKNHQWIMTMEHDFTDWEESNYEQYYWTRATRNEPGYRYEGKIHEYLVETNVLFSDTDFHDFLDMAVNANASNISPNKKWKFITSLWYVATCVNGDQKVWARDICKSIGKKTSDLTKCAEKDPGWLDDLKKLVENNQKNQF